MILIIVIIVIIVKVVIIVIIVIIVRIIITNKNNSHIYWEAIHSFGFLTGWFGSPVFQISKFGLRNPADPQVRKLAV